MNFKPNDFDELMEQISKSSGSYSLRMIAVRLSNAIFKSKLKFDGVWIDTVDDPERFLYIFEEEPGAGLRHGMRLKEQDGAITLSAVLGQPVRGTPFPVTVDTTEEFLSNWIDRNMKWNDVKYLPLQE